MINIIWSSFIIISIVFAILNGNLDILNNSIFESISNTTDFIIKMFRKHMFLVWNN